MPLLTTRAKLGRSFLVGAGVLLATSAGLGLWSRTYWVAGVSFGMLLLDTLMWVSFRRIVTPRRMGTYRIVALTVVGTVSLVTILLVLARNVV